MSDPLLADAYLEQSGACHWIVSGAGVFERVYGDSFPIFARNAPDLVGRPVSKTLDAGRAATWGHRFSRVLSGEVLRLRERLNNGTWIIFLFPIRLNGEILYAGALGREVSAWTAAEQELRTAVLGALKAIEYERKSVSRFLHDSVGQNLTALGLQLDLVRMDLEPSAPEICSRIAEVQKMLEEMMEAVREYSYELNPSTVERAGLRSALDRLVIRVRERFNGNVRLNVDPSLKIDPKVAPAMFNVAQEAVENAIQHAGCTMIELTVKSARSGSYLEVHDNGRGFEPGDIQEGRRGLGLLSMEHYALQAGLELSLVSNRGTGTTVRVVAPKGD
jgi:signal transduction histidine kinase